MPYRLLVKKNDVVLGSVFRQRHHLSYYIVYIALYSIYSTVGWSITSISDLSGIFISALHASVNRSLRYYIYYIQSN